MSNLLRDVLSDIIPQLDDDPMVSVITNIPSCELRTVVQFVMFGHIPPGRQEDSYIPSKGKVMIQSFFFQSLPHKMIRLCCNKLYFLLICLLLAIFDLLRLD